MRRLLFVLVVLFVGSGCMCGGCACPSKHGYNGYVDYRNAERADRKKKVQPVIDALEKYQTTHGKYPEKLNDLVTEKLIDAIPNLGYNEDHQGQPGRIEKATSLQYARDDDDYSLDFAYSYTEESLWAQYTGTTDHFFYHSWATNKTWYSYKQTRPPEKSLPRTLNDRHQGRTAEEWGRDLLEGDDRTSQSAALALRTIGLEGLRFVLKGIQHSQPSVRQRSILVALDPDLAAKYPAVFLPELKSRLNDVAPEVQNAAASAMAQCRFEGAKEALDEAMKRQDDPKIKQHLKEMIETIPTKKP